MEIDGKYFSPHDQLLTSVRFTAETIGKLSERARANQTNVAEEIRTAVRLYLDQELATNPEE